MKKQLLFSFFSFFLFLVAKAQPPINDDCAGAIEIAPSNVFSPTLSTLDNATSSDSVPAYIDVWYKFVATAPAVKMITTQSDYYWKSFAYLYSSCGGPLLLQVDQSASWGVREDLIPGNTYYYRYQASSNVPDTGETFTFGIVNLPITTANDLPAGRTKLQLGLPVQLMAGDYLRGRHNAYYSHKNCNTTQVDSTVIDVFFQFTANGDKASFTLDVDDSTWTSAMEVLDSSALGFVSNSQYSVSGTCFKTGSPTSKSRVYELDKLQHGKTYTLRVEIGGNPTSPVGHSRTVSFAKGFSIVMNTLVSVKENGPFASVRLYPNPNNGSFTIDQVKINTQMEIMDVLGRKVYSALLTKDREEINPQLLPGIYIVSLFKDSYREVLRMEIK